MSENMVRTQVYITNKQKIEIEKEKKESGKSMGSILRKCIDKYFKICK